MHLFKRIFAVFMSVVIALNFKTTAAKVSLENFNTNKISEGDIINIDNISWIVVSKKDNIYNVISQNTIEELKDIEVYNYENNTDLSVYDESNVNILVKKYFEDYLSEKYKAMFEKEDEKYCFDILDRKTIEDNNELLQSVTSDFDSYFVNDNNVIKIYSNEFFSDLDIDNNISSVRLFGRISLNNVVIESLDILDDKTKIFYLSYNNEVENINNNENEPLIVNNDNKYKSVSIEKDSLNNIYRLYNKSTGEHLFTPKESEYKKLLVAGWTSERISFKAYTTNNSGKVPIYRIYNPYHPGGDHHYTHSIQEVEDRIKDGWIKDNNGMPVYYANTSGEPVYRIYNKNNGRHHITMKKGEYKNRVSEGWVDEGYSYFLPKEAIVESYKLGIDVSEHQGKINWEIVKASGIQFAIIRAFNGYKISDYTGREDFRFKENVSECERLGIPYGVYTYSYALTPEEAVSEANSVLVLLEGHYPSYPFFYDLEDSYIKDANHAANAKAFLERVVSYRKGNLRAGVYANLWWFNNKLTDSVFDKYPKWVASYGVSKCTYAKPFKMWQYSSEGSVPGIEGNVDMNRDYE